MTQEKNHKQNQTQRRNKNPNDWLNWYEAHGGHRDLQLSPDELILFHPEHGFITFFIHDEILELHHMAGDGKYWQDVLIKVMKSEGVKTLRAFTRRNPKAWQRKYGGHIRGYYMEADINELKI